MEFLKPLALYLETLDNKKFYYFIAILLSTVAALVVCILLFYFLSVRSLKKQINSLNETRQEVSTIRTTAQHVQNQRAAVDTMLAEEPDFKIAQFFNRILQKPDISLADEEIKEDTAQIDRADNYRESELTAQMESITMKQLAQLLLEIEQKQRIFIKKLDIARSKSTPHRIDVQLTIATLLAKNE